MYLVTSPNDIPYVLDKTELRKYLSNNGFSEFYIDNMLGRADTDKKVISYDNYCIEKLPYDVGTIVNDMTILSYEYMNDCLYAKVMNHYSNIEYIKVDDITKKPECTHPRKYLNKFHTFEFMVCPDCKKEL